MASLYKRGEQFWISYKLNGRRLQQALDTSNERIARDKKRQIEYELTTGTLPTISRLPLATVIEDFCQHLKARSPHKALRTDFGRLRSFFGPICESLHLGTRGGQSKKPSPDKYAHAHLRVELLEDITPEMINRFISARLRESAWAAKTANSHREILHRLFAFAIKHHGFCSRDRRHPNPAAAVERHSEAVRPADEDAITAFAARNGLKLEIHNHGQHWVLSRGSADRLEWWPSTGTLLWRKHERPQATTRSDRLIHHARHLFRAWE